MSDDILDDEDESSPFEIYDKPITNHIYDVYLSSSVEKAEDYTKLRHKLRSMTDKDRVNIHLANYGGDCHGLTGLISAVRTCPALTVMVVDAPCYSAGATLALVGDGLIMNEHSFLMFHNYSGGTHGKGGELESHQQNTKRWIHTYFRKLHRPFLTIKECNMIEQDRDVYIHFDDKDLVQRVERHFR